MLQEKVFFFFLALGLCGPVYTVILATHIKPVTVGEKKENNKV